ncbi:phosphate/phosphite/phosphonate ABC transporter substrate-binding protein [Lysobacter ciconiae]|uniref:Phosphate/phosphite/phosphonate ABC transporter substrate-binding protein n=1 Tax=Novilysobacter ciconiae TaxID=2781022 RepID=A0A7S6ZSZ2_9GAMM|nr:phosphate/phosphite/phosphonate ABC transporter substrate-binding protein [Lysobacter ciconiae]
MRVNHQQDRHGPIAATVARLRSFILAVCLLGVAGTPAWAGESHILVLGRISDDPAAHYEQLKPLLDYVVPRMADVGIREGRILMARDPQQMASYLRRERVDWVTETSGSGALLAERAGARPLLVTERDGERSYHAVFFARADSGITGIDSLQGSRIAFQRPTSTSAYFVPAGQLLRSGLKLDLLMSPLDTVGPDALGYLFARSELNIATWVHKGLVDVGVVSNLDWANPRRMPEAFRKDMVLIGRSEEFPRALELVRANLDPAVRERLRQVLVEAADDPLAAAAMHEFFGTTRFLPLDEEARRELAHLRELVQLVRSQVE